jgi:hypothetical protein
MHEEMKGLLWRFFLDDVCEEEWALLQVHMAYCPDCMMTFRLNAQASQSRPA